jgi:hypothetical protein
VIYLGSVGTWQRYRTEWHCCCKAKQLRRVPSDTSEEEEEKPARPARRRGSDSEDLESGDSLDSAGAPVAPGARAEKSEKSEESGDELFHHQDLQTAEVGSKKSAARVEVPRIEARTSGNFGSASQRSSQRSNHSSDMSNGSEAQSGFQTANVLGLAFLLQTGSNSLK